MPKAVAVDQAAAARAESGEGSTSPLLSGIKLSQEIWTLSSSSCYSLRFSRAQRFPGEAASSRREWLPLTITFLRASPSGRSQG